MKTLLSKIIINLLIYTSKIGSRLSYDGFNHGQNRGFLACVQDICFQVSRVKAEKWETMGRLKPQKTQTPLKVLFGAKYIFYLPHEMLFAGRF